MQNSSQDAPSERQPGLVSLYTLDEAAAILGTSRRQVWSWIQQDALPIIRLGAGSQMIRVRQLDLETFAAETFQPGGPPELGAPHADTDEDALVKE